MLKCALSINGREPYSAVAICLSASLGYLLTALLVTVGAIPDLGIFHDQGAPLWAKVFMTTIVPTVLFLTLASSRVSRRAALQAIEDAVASERDDGRVAGGQVRRFYLGMSLASAVQLLLGLLGAVLPGPTKPKSVE